MFKNYNNDIINITKILLKFIKNDTNIREQYKLFLKNYNVDAQKRKRKEKEEEQKIFEKFIIVFLKNILIYKLDFGMLIKLSILNNNIREYMLKINVIPIIHKYGCNNIDELNKKF